MLKIVQVFIFELQDAIHCFLKCLGVHGTERNAFCLGLQMQIQLRENAKQIPLQFEGERAKCNSVGM